MVYSTLFGTGTPPEAATTFFTVSGPLTVVVRDIEYLNYSGDAASFSVSAIVPGPLSAILLYNVAVASGLTLQWKGRVVLPTGSELQWFSSTESSVATVSGYLLSSP